MYLKKDQINLTCFASRCGKFCSKFEKYDFPNPVACWYHTTVVKRRFDICAFSS